jgi:hypothetical protein
LTGAGPGAAFFGYFLSLQTKSDPPFMAEQKGSAKKVFLREARTEVSARPHTHGTHRNENWIPAFAGMTAWGITALTPTLSQGEGKI